MALAGSLAPCCLHSLLTAAYPRGEGHLEALVTYSPAEQLGASYLEEIVMSPHAACTLRHVPLPLESCLLGLLAQQRQVEHPCKLVGSSHNGLRTGLRESPVPGPGPGLIPLLPCPGRQGFLPEWHIFPLIPTPGVTVPPPAIWGRGVACKCRALPSLVSLESPSSPVRCQSSGPSCG